MDNRTSQASIQKIFRSIAYGVSYLNQTIYFKILRMNATNCSLKLYHRKDSSKNLVIPMERVPGINHVFITSLREFPYSEYEYCFEAMGEEFLEPNVKVVHGRPSFGIREEEIKLRGSFLANCETFDEDAALNTPYHDMILYKLHVRGFTKHESAGVEHPGTYLGLVEKIPYLKELGVNAILLMPITEFDECYQPQCYQSRKEQVYYWGFGTESYYYAPKASYAVDTIHPDQEVKHMVQEMHKNGIEVLMEMNFTPQINPFMITDCLCYWSQEYHIDGFKTNLPEQYRSMIAANPILAKVKLMDTWWNLKEIATFTDGKIPSGLAEYNDGFEVDARRFLKGDEDQLNAYMSRTKYNPEQMAVVNYITNHDGFTLHDLYTYDVKHNEANGENNRDGSEYNYSWNCGIEGETKVRKVTMLRKKMVQNAVLSLFLSQGTPLLLAGDEFGNTQKGNNNVYCQDNELGWLNWNQKDQNKKLFEFTKNIIQLRKNHPILHQEKQMRAMDYIYYGIPDLSFHGTKAWQPNQSYYSRELGVLLCGNYVAMNRREFDQTFYIIYNMHWEIHEFDLPNLLHGMKWSLLLSTDTNVIMKKNTIDDKTGTLQNQRNLIVPARTVCILIGRNNEE